MKLTLFRMFLKQNLENYAQRYESLTNEINVKNVATSALVKFGAFTGFYQKKTKKGSHELKKENENEELTLTEQKQLQFKKTYIAIIEHLDKSGDTNNDKDVYHFVYGKLVAGESSLTDFSKSKNVSVGNTVQVLSDDKEKLDAYWRLFSTAWIVPYEGSFYSISFNDMEFDANNPFSLVLEMIMKYLVDVLIPKKEESKIVHSIKSLAEITMKVDFDLHKKKVEILFTQLIKLSKKLASLDERLADYHKFCVAEIKDAIDRMQTQNKNLVEANSIKADGSSIAIPVVSSPIFSVGVAPSVTQREGWLGVLTCDLSNKVINGSFHTLNSQIWKNFNKFHLKEGAFKCINESGGHLKSDETLPSKDICKLMSDKIYGWNGKQLGDYIFMFIQSTSEETNVSTLETTLPLAQL